MLENKLVPGFSHHLRWNKFIRSVHPSKYHKAGAFATAVACYDCHSQSHKCDDGECPILETVKSMVEIIVLLRDVHKFEAFCDCMLHDIQNGRGLPETMNFLGNNITMVKRLVETAQGIFFL